MTTRQFICKRTDGPASCWRLVIFLFVALLLQACSGNDNRGPRNSEDAAQYNAQLGAQYLQRGDLDQAREKLTKALEQDYDNALAHVTYAKLQYRVEQVDSANKHFKHALDLEPDEAEHRNSYGIYLCNVKRYALARKQFRLAADNPYYKTPEFALDNAGICMLDAGDLDEAERYLREALRTNTKFGNAYLHMAELMLRRERITVAEAYFDRYKVYGQETSESLWLGYKIKRTDGDLLAAENYGSQLLDKFPASAEAGKYLTRSQ
ncbi:MAG: type IV pilus biogenesis/stability protein PilW [Granulosicoccus sp.]